MHIVNRFYLILAIIISTFFISLANANKQRLTDFETISKGIDSQYNDTENSQLIEIYNHEEWVIFWKKHANRPNYPFPAPPLPEVDFRNFYVLVVLDQARGSGGYDLEITKVIVDSLNENKPFHIVTALGQPGRYTATTAEINRPYHIIKIRR